MTHAAAGNGGAEVDGMPAGRARRARWVLAPLCLLLILWIWLFAAEGAFKGGPSGKSFEADFAMFYTAAMVSQHGGNPYDHTHLYAAESTLMRSQGLTVTPKHAVVRVGNPPLFFWVLRPATRVGFQVAAYAWLALMYVLSLAGFLCALALLGWRRRVFPAVLFLAMPPVLLGAFYGNVVPAVFAAMSAALLLQRKMPVVAGILLTLAWLKPPVALPLVLVVLLVHAPRRRRLAAGFAGGTAAMIALTLVCTGPTSLSEWFRGLFGYSRDMGIQPDVASLAGLYVHWAPSPLRLVIEVLVVGVALAVTCRLWLTSGPRRPLSFLAAGWIWFAWMLATPYAHYFDEILLTIPLLALLGRDGVNAGRPGPALTLYLSFLSLLFVEAEPGKLNLLCVFLLLTAWVVFRARNGRGGDLGMVARTGAIRWTPAPILNSGGERDSWR